MGEERAKKKNESNFIGIEQQRKYQRSGQLANGGRAIKSNVKMRKIKKQKRKVTKVL